MPVIDLAQWPGPPYDPVVFDGSFPHIAHEGDLYVSPRQRMQTLNGDWIEIGTPLVYQLIRGDWKMVPYKEVEEFLSSTSPSGQDHAT